MLSRRKVATVIFSKEWCATSLFIHFKSSSSSSIFKKPVSVFGCQIYITIELGSFNFHTSFFFIPKELGKIVYTERHSLWTKLSDTNINLNSGRLFSRTQTRTPDLVELSSECLPPLEVPFSFVSLEVLVGQRYEAAEPGVPPLLLISVRRKLWV